MIKLPAFLLTRNERLKRLVKYLRKLGRHEIDPDYDCIHHIIMKFDEGLHHDLNKSHHLLYAIEDWSHYSGNYVHPVNSDKPRLNFIKGNTWTGEYGKQCRELCLHLAQYIEDEVL